MGTCTFVRFIVTLLALGAAGAVHAQAAPAQPPWEHTTVSTSDGSIRDDDLADFLCQQLLANGLDQVSDVKLMVNSCYGGGLIDDLARVFGPDGACSGVPWVAGAASRPDQVAWGWTDEFVNREANEGKNLGSTWTDALAGSWRQPNDSTDGSIRTGSDGDRVIDDLRSAGEHDALGPKGTKKENPVVAAGNGGEDITWTGAKKHEAVIFGGRQTNDRHSNNIENVDEALDDVWADEDGANTNAIDGGTTQDLKDAITAAAGRLDGDTQFVLYIDDHGDTHFDVLEYLAFLNPTLQLPLVVDPIVGLELALPVHEGWPAGIAGNLLQDDPPTPAINLFTELLPPDGWTVLFNGVELPLPPGPVTGPVELPIPPELLLAPRPYQLAIFSDSPSSQPLVLFALTLDSGPINEAPSLPFDAHFRSGFEARDELWSFLR